MLLHCPVAVVRVVKRGSLIAGEQVEGCYYPSHI